MGTKSNSNNDDRGSAEQQQQGQRPPIDSLKSDDDIPACQACRRKKAKCSREQPCSQCVRLDTPCIYEGRRLKPGLRAGVIDSLSRRIETLEDMFLGQEILWKQMWQTLHPNLEFPGIPSAAGNDKSTGNGTDLRGRRDQLKNSLLDLANIHRCDSSNFGIDNSSGSGDMSQPPAKRQRRDLSPPSSALPPQEQHEDIPQYMTASDIIDSDLMPNFVEFYFQNIHHWIPILHVRRFRNQIRYPEGRQKAVHILHAIIAVGIRFVHDPRLGDDETKAKTAETSRQNVVLSSMESFSVQSLQALVIIAFDTIARGRGPSSWSIVGSMARTVEQLQLSVEEDDLRERKQAGEALIRRMAFLRPSTCWVEVEERRRVFWTVFLMDRFCSLSTGWNVSLTSADVKRRLPCEGALWEREDEAKPSYFGISDTKEATTPHRSLLVDSPAMAHPAEQESIGGFAYCIEATESLSLVSNFFVHQPLDVRDGEKAQLWLMRFKELDLRLVQWKLFLPSKWREASTLNADGIMDSNLTLAHITHNAAVILLHQAIAYPPLHWKICPVKLPSLSSAETCIEAASEISTIGQQFLLHSPILVSPQFSFCLFIAGRMLLTHSSRYNNANPIIAPALDTLIASLFEISDRWKDPRSINDAGTENLASAFAKRLVRARDNNTSPMAKSSLDIRQTVYSEATEHEDEEPVIHTTGPPASSTTMAMNQPHHHHQLYQQYGELQSPDGANSFDPSLTLAFPPLPLSFQQNFAPFMDSDTDVFGLQLGGSEYQLPSQGAAAFSNRQQQQHVPEQNTWTNRNSNNENNIPSPYYTRLSDHRNRMSGSPRSAETIPR